MGAMALTQAIALGLLSKILPMFFSSFRPIRTDSLGQRRLDVYTPIPSSFLFWVLLIHSMEFFWIFLVSRLSYIQCKITGSIPRI